MNSVKSIIANYQSLTDNIIIDIVFYGYSQFNENTNKINLEATITYLRYSE